MGTPRRSPNGRRPLPGIPLGGRAEASVEERMREEERAVDDDAGERGVAIALVALALASASSR